MALRVLPGSALRDGPRLRQALDRVGHRGVDREDHRDDLVEFHRTWFKPNHATLIVVGATTMAEIRPKLERLFAGWRPGDVPAKNIADVDAAGRPTVYLLDRPGAQQTVILAGNLAPPKANPDEPAIETMNAVLGGDFGSRLNMNLREDKHWSYGAAASSATPAGQRPFIAYAPVQTDKTKESIVELQKELREFSSGRPVDAGRAGRRPRRRSPLTLPGEWETIGAVAGTIGEIVAFGLDDRYFDTYADKVRAVRLARDSRGRGRRWSTPTSSSGSSWATAPRSRPGSGS